MELLKGQLSEVMGMSLPGQPAGGWLVPAGQHCSVYTQAPVPVGETSLQGPDCSLRILVLLIFTLD